MTTQWRAAPRFLACLAAGAALAVPTVTRAQQAISLDEAVHAFVRGAWRHLCAHRDLVLVAIREVTVRSTVRDVVG